jgi:hypothetical protein
MGFIGSEDAATLTALGVEVAPDLFTNGGALRCLKRTFAALTDGQARRSTTLSPSAHG